MKFRFCGDGDCPDWVLAEIHSTLSVLTSVKLRLLAQNVAKSILGEDIKEEKLLDTFAHDKDTKNTGKSAFACIRFLLVSASRHNTDSNTFNAELQQLGLPKEHSTALCRVRDEYAGEIRKYLASRSLTVNELDGVAFHIPEGTIDCVQLELKIKNEIVNGVPQPVTHRVNVSREDVAILLKEAKTIRNIMETCDYEKKYNEN